MAYRNGTYVAFDGQGTMNRKSSNGSFQRLLMLKQNYS